MSTDPEDAEPTILETAAAARVPFPAKISDEEAIRYFSFSDADRDHILALSRGDENRIGFALQLGHVRWCGRFATAFETVEPMLVRHVTRQLGLAFSSLFFRYPDRERTRREHNAAIRKYLGLRSWNPSDAQRLREDLLRQAARGLRERDLVPAAERLLRSWNIVLPGASVLSDLARSVLAGVEDTLVETVGGRLDSDLGRRLEDLLKVPSGRRRSPLEDLKRAPKRASAPTLLGLCERLETLREIGVDLIDLSGLTVDQRADFADRVRHYDVSKMARFRSAKKRTYLTCFLVQTRTAAIDASVKAFSRIVLSMQSRVRQKLLAESEDFREAVQKELEEWTRVGGLIIRPENAVRRVDEAIFPEVPSGRIAASIDRARELALSKQATIAQKLAGKYGFMRRFTPALLSALEFLPGPGGEDLVRALEMIRDANRDRRKKLPEDLPRSFIKDSWKDLVMDAEGAIRRGPYEVSAFLALKEAIDQGRIFVKNSKKYVSPASLVYSHDAWASRRVEAYQRLGLPLSFDEFLSALSLQLARAAEKTDAGWSLNSYARIENGRLKLSKEAAEADDPEVLALRDLIEARMPSTRVERLLSQVADATGCLDAFQAPSGFEGRLSPDKLKRALLAGTLALGTNLGLWTMGQMARGISYSNLAHVADWYLREMLVSEASSRLVNAHHALPISKVWGEGERSSHDGIRFSSGVPTLLAEPNPKYFGWGDGLTSYKSMSDQWTIFATQLISCHESEALRMLDALLSNKTALPLGEGTATDDAAATELNFALCNMTGHPFWPRIAEMDKVRLWKLDPSLKTKHLEDLFDGCVDVDLLRSEYDNVVRLLATLVDGLAPAHILGRCLSASASTNPLARALLAWGSIYRTIYVLQVLDSPELRKAVRRLLARHESQNALGRKLDLTGEFRVVDYEAAAARAACHTFLENAVLYWNTSRITEIVQALRLEGREAKDEHLADISPLMFKHINFRGTYEFDVETAPQETDGEE